MYTLIYKIFYVWILTLQDSYKKYNSKSSLFPVQTLSNTKDCVLTNTIIQSILTSTAALRSQWRLG